MSSIGSWIELDQRILNAPVHENIRGADVAVMVPPQDFPQAVRSYFDSLNKWYVIEFKYPSGGGEPLIAGAENDIVECMIGRESGRLFQVRISADQRNAEIVASSLMDALGPAIEQLNAREQVPRRTANYRATAGVIKSKRRELIEDVVLR